MAKDILYSKWKCMKARVREIRPFYEGVTIAESFHTFKDFKAWAETQIGAYEDGWQLDKDILKAGNKIYCPELCVFVPGKLNMMTPTAKAVRGALPIGVSKEMKGMGNFTARCSIDGKSVKFSGFKDPESAFNKYKEIKEANIKRLAEKFKDQVDPRVYAALINMRVSITD